MDFILKGQLSTLVLTSLMKSDMYGLEIIQDINTTSNGEVVIKQPSLYSCLKRMEAAGYISSYWKMSEVGGNRHYYSITDLGLKQFKEMQFELIDSHRKVRNLIGEKSKEKSPTILEQQSIFTLSKESIKEESEPKKNSVPSESKVIQFDIFTEPKIEMPAKNDAVFYDKSGNITKEAYSPKTNMEELAKEFKKLKSRKSFAEDQIAMSVDSSKNEFLKEEQLAHNKELLKDTVQKAKFDYSPTNVLSQFDRGEPINPLPENEPDRAIFITDRIVKEALPKVKKIEPAKLDIYAKTVNKHFPEPVKGASGNSLYPNKTDKDFTRLIDSLYNHGNEFCETPLSYKALGAYYKAKGIWFQEYSKSAKEKIYRTNKIHLLRSAFIMFFIFLITGLCYLIFSLMGFTNASTDFLYIIPPALALIYFTYFLYKYLFMESKPPRKPWSLFTSIGIYIIAAAITVGSHVVNYSVDFLGHATTLIFPCIILIVIPINNLLENLLYKKFTF